MEKDLFISEFSEEKNRITLKILGEVDHHSALPLRRAVDEMLVSKRPQTLVIDLSAVDFMYSSGLGFIMGRYTLMEKLGGRTVLRDPSEKTKKILSLAGIERIIKIERTKKDKNEAK